MSFATYGLLRKIAPVDAVAGLAIETAILFPFAAGWLIWGLAAGTPIFGTSQLHVVLIAFAGIVTAAVLLFTAAPSGCATTLGICNSLPPLQFLLAVSIYGEPFTGRMRSHSARSGERSLSTSSPSSAMRERPSPCPSEEHGAVSPIVMAVKWVLTALAFLAVAACDPYYGQEPYGPWPYPYPDPALSAGSHPPAPGGYPGPAPYQPLPPECLITSSREWTAWVNRMPGPGGRGPCWWSPERS